jgi:hypothetical protein
MRRVMITALVVGTVAALLLLQLERAQELWMWEVLLVGTVIWMARQLPEGGAIESERRLFEARSASVTRLPRAVSAAEMSTVDALAGTLGRDQRIRPVLERIAVQRLQRHGFDLESSEAMDSLGEDQWRWLTGREGVLRPGELEHLVSGLERL